MEKKSTVIKVRGGRQALTETEKKRLKSDRKVIKEEKTESWTVRKRGKDRWNQQQDYKRGISTSI